MPMIQIEQDSPELIAQVRRQIDEMVERTRKTPGIVHVAEEVVHGYLAALLEQRLLSVEQWRQLLDASRAASEQG